MQLDVYEEFASFQAQRSTGNLIDDLNAFGKLQLLETALLFELVADGLVKGWTNRVDAATTVDIISRLHLACSEAERFAFWTRIEHFIAENRAPYFDLKLEAVIGRGGTATVYLAHHGEREERPVAVKVYNRVPAKVFANDARAMLLSENVGIVSVHDKIIFQTYPALVMEYCAGGSLAEAIRPSDPEQPPRLAHPNTADDFKAVASLVVRILDSLAVAHRLGVFHCDLTPNNVLFYAFAPDSWAKVAEATAKITDFSQTSGIEPDKGGRQLHFGTPGFHPPAGESWTGPNLDLFGLGGILFFCLTGEPPVQGGVVRRVQDIRPRASSVPWELRYICDHCLFRTAPSRYVNSSAERSEGALDRLRADLLAFQGDFPLAGVPVNPAYRLKKWVKRKPLVAALTSIFAVLLLSAFGTGVWTYWTEVESERRKVELERRQDFDRTVNAAYLNQQRGNFAQSDRDFDTALRHPWQNAGEERRLRLVVDRVVNWLSIKSLEQLDAEFFWLEREYGVLEDPRYLLLKADYLGSNFDKEKEGLDFIQLALKRDGEIPRLSAADKHYAAAMLASDAKAAKDSLLLAIRAERHHFRANLGYAVVCVVMSDFREARRHAEICQAAFPENDQFYAIDAFCRVIEGDRAGGIEKYRSFPGGISKEKQQAVERFFGHFEQLQNAVRRGNPLARIFAAMPALEAIGQDGATVVGEFQIPSFAVRHLRRLELKDPIAVFGLAMNEKARAQFLDGLLRSHPDGILLHLAAAWQLEAAGGRGLPADQRRILAQKFSEAADAQSFVPHSDLQLEARLEGILLQCQEFKEGLEPDRLPLEAAKLFDALAAAVKVGRSFPAERKKYDAKMVRALPEFAAVPYVHQLLGEEPKNPEPLKQLASRFLEADKLDESDYFLTVGEKHFPGDARFRSLRDRLENKKKKN